MIELVAVVSDGSDQAALVGLLKASCNLIGTSEPSAVVAIGMVQGALEGVGIHSRGDDAMTLWAVGQAWLICLRQGNPFNKKAPAIGRGLKTRTVDQFPAEAKSG